MSVTTLMEERATLYAQARAIIEKDDGEITAEEERKVDAMFSDADAITDKIQKEERTSRLKHQLGPGSGRVDQLHRREALPRERNPPTRAGQNFSDGHQHRDRRRGNW